MSRSWRTLLPALALLAALPLAALPVPPAEDFAAQRARLAAWRNHPAEYARRKADAVAFLALPAARQERMRRLDHDLSGLHSSARKHLFDVMERYAAWLERLPEGQRRQVIEAPDKHTRLKKIKEIREGQWERRQPLAVRQQLKQLRALRPALGAVAAAGLASPRSDFGPAVGALAAPFLAPASDPLAIAQLREEERQRRSEWRIALRHWDAPGKDHPLPARLADVPEVEAYVKQYLLPLLAPDEKERLQRAEGRWPLFPRTLVELADRHPPALPGPRGPTSFKELPQDVQARLLRSAHPKGLKGDSIVPKMLRVLQGRWPQYAESVVDFMAKRGRPLALSERYEFWPSRPTHLSADVKKFLKDRLQIRLTEREKELLHKSEDRWPEYPLRIQELADRYYLTVPWQTLPGKRQLWDAYRLSSPTRADGLPELPRAELRDFAVLELKPQERAALDLSADDPSSYRRLLVEYFKRKPEEERRLREQDARHPLRPQAAPFLHVPGGPKGRP